MNSTAIPALREELRAFLPTQSGELSHEAATSALVLAKIDKSVDVMAQMQEGFDHFIKSGQVWALLIGFVLGYLFRNFTAY
jgi:hypothetical protein